jgi:predicted dehydrogenase
LVGIADPSPDAAAFASRHNISYFSNHLTLLEGVKPEGVIIAAPNALHTVVGIDCAARRVPMLMEKPIADTVEAAQRLIDAARATNTPLLVGHHRRHNPVLAAAREIVQGGRLGTLTAVTILWLLQKPSSYFEAAAWRREKGGGPLLINVIHDIDDLRFIAGEVTSVQAMTANAARGFAVEDTAAVTLRLENGALATITLSDAVASPWAWELTSGENPSYPRVAQDCYFFTGTSGSLTLPGLEFWRYGTQTGWAAPLERERIDAAAADPYTRQLQHFCRVIAREEAPLVSGEDAARTLAVILAIQRAAETGQAVAL